MGDLFALRGISQCVVFRFKIDALTSRKFEDVLRIWLLIVPKRAELKWHRLKELIC